MHLTIIEPQISETEWEEVRQYNQLLKNARVPEFPKDPFKRAVAMRESLLKAPFISQPHPDTEIWNIPSATGEVPVRVIIPPQVDAVYLDIHGGGWVVGNATIGERLNWAMAKEANVAVVSVDYRLAPEHPYPAAVEDCEEVALWILEHGKAQLGSDRVIMGGESAGANLAVLTLLRMREKYDAIAHFIGANLFYGVYDLGGTPSHLQGDNERNFDLTPAQMAWFIEMFLPGLTPEERRNSQYSPLYADLTRLPPAFFTVSQPDLLLDDSLFMAMRWAAAGNSAQLAVYPELPHGFTLLPLTMAENALTRSRDFVKSLVES